MKKLLWLQAQATAAVVEMPNRRRGTNHPLTLYNKRRSYKRDVLYEKIDTEISKALFRFYKALLLENYKKSYLKLNKILTQGIKLPLKVIPLITKLKYNWW